MRLIVGSGVSDFQFKQVSKRILKECVQQIRNGCEWLSVADINTIIVVVGKYLNRQVLSVTAAADNRY